MVCGQSTTLETELFPSLGALIFRLLQIVNEVEQVCGGGEVCVSVCVGTERQRQVVSQPFVSKIYTYDACWVSYNLWLPLE